LRIRREPRTMVRCGRPPRSIPRSSTKTISEYTDPQHRLRLRREPRTMVRCGRPPRSIPRSSTIIHSYRFLYSSTGLWLLSAI
jgi:hypothetical protein